MRRAEGAGRLRRRKLWKLTCEDGAGLLTCEDDNGRAVFTKPIPFTDFPGEDVTLYCCNGTILLPGEE
jgi:hypothetical protein